MCNPGAGLFFVISILNFPERRRCLSLARAPQGPARAIADKIEPLALAVREDAPARVNVLIPTIDLEHFFGGYIAKLNLARNTGVIETRYRTYLGK